LLFDSSGLKSRIGAIVQGFEEKTLGCFSIPRWAEEELDRVPLRIDGSVEIRPRFFDLNRGFIDAPGVVTGFEMRSTAFFQFWSVATFPSDRSWYDPQATLAHPSFLEGSR
jgi:hypothetical protein